MRKEYLHQRERDEKIKQNRRKIDEDRSSTSDLAEEQRRQAAYERMIDAQQQTAAEQQRMQRMRSANRNVISWERQIDIDPTGRQYFPPHVPTQTTQTVLRRRKSLARDTKLGRSSRRALVPLQRIWEIQPTPPFPVFDVWHNWWWRNVQPIPYHDSARHIRRLFNAACKFSERVQRRMDTELSDAQQAS